VAKYTFRNPDGMYTTSFGLLMNDDSYNDLSDKHRKCIDDMRGVELSRKIGKYWDEADDLGYEKFAEMGGTVTDASPAERAYYKEKTSGIEAQIVAAASDRGVDGKAALAYYRSLLN
jgi:TRAP-type C4-dicarboxylate transport system substrate-binding protein